MVRLKRREWYAHKLDSYGGSSNSYPAICQRLGNVTVLRDGPDGTQNEDTGHGLSINIHRCSCNGTCYLDCQTIHPDQ